jgi:hypothetical protein
MSSLGHVWAVNWNLLKILTDSMAMSVGIRKEPRLEHLVIGGLDSWNKMTRRECDLLNLSEVILGIFIESESANSLQRVVRVRPDLSHIENVILVIQALLLRH